MIRPGQLVWHGGLLGNRWPSLSTGFIYHSADVVDEGPRDGEEEFKKGITWIWVRPTLQSEISNSVNIPLFHSRP